MTLKIEVGQSVRLLSATGIIERVVADVKGDTVLVCRQTEYDDAKRRRRRPVTVGFPTDSIVPDGEGEETG